MQFQKNLHLARDILLKWTSRRLRFFLRISYKKSENHALVQARGQKCKFLLLLEIIIFHTFKTWNCALVQARRSFSQCWKLERNMFFFKAYFWKSSYFHGFLMIFLAERTNIGPKLSQSSAKMFPRLPRCSQDASEADFGTQNGPKTVAKRSQNGSKTVPK